MKLRNITFVLITFLTMGWVLTSLTTPAWATNHSGTCAGTFAAADNPHVLTGYCTIPAGQVLTIEPGVVVNGQGLTFTVDGTLNANGATLNQAQVTYNTGSGGTIQNSMIFDATVTIKSTVNISTSTLDNTFVSFTAGSGGSITNSILSGPAIQTAIPVANSSPSFIGNTFTGMNVAIGLSGTTNVVIDNNVFDTIATVVSLGGVTSRAQVSNNTFMQNTVAVSFATADTLFSSFPTQFGTNTFVGSPDKNTLQLPSTIGVSGTLVAVPVPYRFGSTTISPGATLNIQPGTVMQGVASASLTVDGELVAVGTPVAPIVFTSAKPKSGTRWGGLQINTHSTASPTILDSTVVEFAGTLGAVRLSNADIQIKNSLIADNADEGIVLSSGSDATITGNAIVQNAGHGVTMTSSNPVLFTQNSIFSNGGNGVINTSSCSTTSGVVKAEYNYWGDDSGPLDSVNDQATGLHNPNGLGDQVSNCVDYDPWIHITPSIAGTLERISGGGQVGTVGSVLPQPLVVELRSTLGSLLANIDVIFSVIEGGASIVEMQPVKTDANGRAAVRVQLGLTPGPITIAVTARDVNSQLAIFTGTGSSGGGLLGFGLQALPVALDIRPGKKGGTGDINNDGKVNNTDATILAAVLEGVLTPDAPPALNFSRSGDVNRDGQIDDADAFTLQGYTVGMISQAR